MPHDINYYLDKGFEPAMAEYFAGGRRMVVNVLPKEDFTLLLTFDNGEKRIYDMNPVLDEGGVFAPFREFENFRRVYIDDCGAVAWDIAPDVDSNAVWNNKVDISPDTCYVFSKTIKNN